MLCAGGESQEILTFIYSWRWRNLVLRIRGLMANMWMYSFFGEQEGDFELVIRSIAAVKEEVEVRYRDDPDVGTSGGRGREEKFNCADEARMVGLDLRCICEVIG